MKKLLTLATVMFCFVILSAQDNTKTTAPKKEKLPAISFEKTVHDYGNIIKGGDGTSEFEFKNTGKADLVLTNVRSSCGCTVPQWPREPIAPGKTGVIKVKYDTNRIGMINKSITVESNAPEARIVLNIKGNVSAPPPEATPETTPSPLQNAQ